MNYDKIKVGQTYKRNCYGIVTKIKIISKQIFKGAVTGEKYYTVKYEYLDRSFLGCGKGLEYGHDKDFEIYPLDADYPIQWN